LVCASGDPDGSLPPPNAGLIREKRGLIASTIAREQGKLLSLATTEVDFTADYVDYMPEWARRTEGGIIPSDRPNETILLFRKPVGVVGGILPWNFPSSSSRARWRRP
jgi:lactaldehyde dehydrogenase/glycolaldehyde dehydrogenase